MLRGDCPLSREQGNLEAEVRKGTPDTICVKPVQNDASDLRKGFPERSYFTASKLHASSGSIIDNTTDNCFVKVLHGHKGGIVETWAKSVKVVSTFGMSQWAVMRCDERGLVVVMRGGFQWSLDFLV